MALVYLIAGLAGVSVAAWSAWATAVAFIGGDIPLLPIHFTGFNLVRGVAWLFFADPVLVGVMSVVLALALSPIGLAAGAAKKEVKAPLGVAVISIVVVAALAAGITWRITSQGHQPVASRSDAPVDNVYAHLARTIAVPLIGDEAVTAYYTAGQYVQVVCTEDDGFQYGAYNGKTVVPVNRNDLDAKITGDVPMPCGQWFGLHPTVGHATRAN